MLSVLLAALIGVVIAVATRKPIARLWLAPVLAFVTSLCVLVGGALVHPTYGPGCYDTRLVALNVASTIHGSFFLGIGSVDGVLEYQYYYTYDGKQFFLGLEPATKTYHTDSEASVVEEDVKSPFIRICPPDVHSRWLIVMGGNYGDVVEFHVPKGSILRDVDLRLP